MLYDATIIRIAQNKKVRAKIRDAIKDELLRNDLVESDRHKLTEIMLKHFC